METETYNLVNRAWKSTTKILFGQEIGELKEFEDYLKEAVFPYTTQKSFLSGKEVIVSMPFYSPNSRFISQEEIDKLKFPPLSINEIKDIDSLLSAASERTIYCGNKTFGKCSQVESIDNCTDCVAVMNSHDGYNIRYAAYVSYLRESEHAFGVSSFPNSRYAIRCIEGIGLNRCFECFYSRNLNDSYFCYNCSGCGDCLFAFNQRSKHYVLGNLELPKDKYLALKKKLLSEMAEKLKKEKRLFSIADISKHGQGEPVEQPVLDGQVPEKVEEAFRKTTHLIFGNQFQDVRQYGPWLSERILKIRKIKGAFGKPTYKVDGLPIVRDISSKRLLTLNEALSTASSHIEISDIGSKDISLADVFDKVSKIAYFTFEFIDGFNENNVDTPTVFTAVNTYKIWDGTNSKYAAYSTGAVHSSYVFGGIFWILHSEFCVKCYNPTNVKACFEVDSSHAINNCYYCHNCENVQDGIFCFNTKSKRYAVCNVEVGREEYLRVKKILLDYLNQCLKEKSNISLSIFNVGTSH